METIALITLIFALTYALILALILAHNARKITRARKARNKRAQLHRDTNTIDKL